MFFFRKQINISVTLVSESYVLLYCEKKVYMLFINKICLNQLGYIINLAENKRDDFNFPMVNFPFICSNIPAAHAYEVYISQFIWLIFQSFNFLSRFPFPVLLLTRKLLKQWFLVKLKSSPQKFYNCHHDCVSCYRLYMSEFTTFCSSWSKPCPSFLFMTYHRSFNKSNKMEGTSGAGTVYSSGAHTWRAPSFQWGSCCSISSFLCSVL